MTDYRQDDEESIPSCSSDHPLHHCKQTGCGAQSDEQPGCGLNHAPDQWVLGILPYRLSGGSVILTIHLF